MNARRIKVLFSVVAGITLGIIAYIDYLALHGLIVLITTALSAVLLSNALYLTLRKSSPHSNYIEWLLMVLLALFSFIASGYDQGQNIYWIYFYPIAAFFLFPMRWALFLMLLYIPNVLFIISSFAPPLEQAQIFFSFASISTVAIFLAVVKSRTNELLEPLINSDVETGAQQEKFLRPNLSTEIIRAEREGTGLLLIYIDLGKEIKSLRKEIRTKLLLSTSQTIAATMRPFDRYYRIDQDNFALLLPHTTSQEALTAAKFMLKNIPTPLQEKDIKIGLASLNVGDTADTLISTAKQELSHV